MTHKGQKLTDEEKQSRYQHILDWNVSEEGQDYYNKLNEERLNKEQEYLKNPKLCMECSNAISYEKRESNRFCSLSCSANYNNRKRKENGWKQSEESCKKVSKSLMKYHKENPKEKTIKNIFPCICLYCKQIFNVKSKCYTKTRKYCSKKCSHKASKGRIGHYREGIGSPKTGWYKGYFCGSFYELAWIIYNIDHNISFERNKEGFPYIFENKKRLYYPDFILSDGSYIEIKGFSTPKHEAKISQFPYSIKVLYKKDLQDVFDYVKSIYGTDFIELYEGNPHNERKNKCQLCGAPAKKLYCSRYCGSRKIKRK